MRVGKGKLQERVMNSEQPCPLQAPVCLDHCLVGIPSLESMSHMFEGAKHWPHESGLTFQTEVDF